MVTIRMSDHTQDPISGAWLPERIEMSWPATGFSLSINVAHYDVNLPPPNTKLFQLPQYEGYPTVDLADPKLQLRMPTRPVSPAPAVPTENRPPNSQNPGDFGELGTNTDASSRGQSGWSLPHSPASTGPGE